MSVLEFEVNPEISLKNEQVELILGAPINQVLAAVRHASKIIKNVELVYCNKEPFSRDITILLKDEGIRLVFDAYSQVLKLIEVYDFRNINLRYGNTTFSSPSGLADVSKVENCFGATHPGVYDEKHKTYLLHWRGVSFSFPAKEPSTVQPAYAHGLSSLNFSSLPLLEKMEVYCGSTPNEIKIPETSVLVHCGNVFSQKISTVFHENEIYGLKLMISGDDNKQEVRKSANLLRTEKRILFGDSEEQVLASLGAPSRVFYKSEEKMLIQKGLDSKKLSDGDSTDIFFNYFSLGLDVLFDAKTREVIKLVLHTNIPGHYNFGFYSRANFEVDCSTPDDFGDETVVIRTASKLTDFINIFEDKTPVVVNRAPSSEGENPFGSTFCYGTDGMIVEVLDNAHIASLTLYKSGLNQKFGESSDDDLSKDSQSS